MDALWQVLAGIVLTLTATVVGVNALQSRGRHRTLHGPVPGRDILPRVRRYNTAYHPPRFQGLRSRSPRLGVGRAVGVVAVILIVGLVAMAATGQLNRREANRSTESDSRIAEITARRMDGERATSSITSWAIFIETEARLQEMLDSGRLQADDPRVLDEQARLTAAIDELEQAAPLGAVQVIGGVPDAPSGVKPQLVAGGGGIWLLSNAVYRVDVASATLVQVLHEGDTVDAATVGQIRAITWRQEQLVAVDATQAFILDSATGSWNAEQLGQVTPEGYPNVLDADTYDFNLYLLDPIAGRILKFTAGLYSGLPEDWTGGVEQANLMRGVDMAVDGHVWVLRDDGVVLDFFQSKLNQTLAPTIVPPLPGAQTLHVTASSPFVHLIGTDGRVLRIARDGSLTQQFTPAPGSTLLSNALALTIDETTGIAYIVANGQLLTTRLPSPPAAPAAEPDPGTTPDPDATESGESGQPAP